jgi:hypothetical protein
VTGTAVQRFRGRLSALRQEIDDPARSARAKSVRLISEEASVYVSRMPVRGELQLRSGRIVHVMELRQWPTYEGLLVGLPNARRNGRLVDDILVSERGKFYGADPLLLKPKTSPMLRPDGKPSRPAAAWLPAIVCVARLECQESVRDRSKDFSGLGVVWFQPDFAFPIEPEPLEQLLAIDWDRHAVDCAI